MDNLGLKRGTVRLIPHCRSWKKEFRNEKKLLAKQLDDFFIDIQHIGSTAIPSIKAKPIIDIGIGVKSLAEVSKYSKLLKPLGYRYREKASTKNRHLFFAKGPEHRRTHYVHITKYAGKQWKNDLFFRDYLISHPSTAKRYEKLKMTLANKYPENRKSYTKSKSLFIRQILKYSPIISNKVHS